MQRHERNAPIWLFSFVDLAFLLLIAFTQITPDRATEELDVGQIAIPRIATAAEPLDRNPSAATWQLRVHPPGIDGVASDTPYELTGPATRAASGERIGQAELAARLDLLHARSSSKPILAPHRDSRSEDLLIAVGLLEEEWRADRTVAVVPGPAVAAGPDAGTASR